MDDADDGEVKGTVGKREKGQLFECEKCKKVSPSPFIAYRVSRVPGFFGCDGQTTRWDRERKEVEPARGLTSNCTIDLPPLYLPRQAPLGAFFARMLHPHLSPLTGPPIPARNTGAHRRAYTSPPFVLPSPTVRH